MLYKVMHPSSFFLETEGSLKLFYNISIYTSITKPFQSLAAENKGFLE